MKRQADKNRSERSFVVGDMMFVKLQPYVQSSLAPWAHQKLCFKFFGPFRVLARIGSVAYKLELPESSLVHPIFHVLQLKQAVPSAFPVTPDFPAVDLSLQIPERVLDHCFATKGVASVQQVLING